MSLSQIILEWYHSSRGDEVELEQFRTDLKKLKNALDPFHMQGVTEQMTRGVSAFDSTLDAWRRLEQFWKVVETTDPFARRDALLQEVEGGKYLEFMGPLLRKRMEVLTPDFLEDLFRRAGFIEEDLERNRNDGVELGKELSAYTNGGLEISLELKPHEDVDRVEVLGKIPITHFSLAGKIYFPKQQLATVTRRWMYAAAALGYDHVKLIGTKKEICAGRKDIDEGDTRTKARSFKGYRDLAEARAILTNSHLTSYRTGLPISIVVEIVEYIHNRPKLNTNLFYEGIDDRGKVYLDKIAPILDLVAQSYR